MSRTADEEREFEYAEARNEERVARIKAARRLEWVAAFSALVNPPEPWETGPCSQCGCRLEASEGTTCEGKDDEGCGLRVCAHCARVLVVVIESAGERAGE